MSRLDWLDDLLPHVPEIDVPFDGDGAQANGVDLPIVVLNLPRRTDRWELLRQRMAAVGINKLTKVAAIEGAKLPDSQVAAILRSTADGIDAPPSSHLTLNRPAIGCFLSHLALWRWLIRSGLPRLLILEDDARPTDDFRAERFRSVLASLSAEKGLVLVGRLIMGGLADRPDGADIARIYYFNGTVAYLITPAACEGLMPLILPPRAHIDHQISGVLIEQRRTLAAWSVEPPLFEPDWSLNSDISGPMADESAADRALGEVIEATRRMLLAEGRPLLPP